MKLLLVTILIINSIITNRVSGIQRELESIIKHNYEGDGRYEYMEDKYDKLQRRTLDSYGKDVCLENRNLISELRGKNLTRIKNQVERGPFLLTIDEENYFTIPAFLNCSVSIPHEIKIEYYLIFIIREPSQNLEFKRIYDDEMAQTELPAYILAETNRIKNIRSAYRNQWDYSGIAREYKESNKICEHLTDELCEILRPVWQDENTVEEWVVYSGRYQLGNFPLFLDEDNSVNIPGVLVCELKFGYDGTTKYKYLIMEDYIDCEFLVIYKTKKLVNNQTAFALEEYLVHI